MIAARADPYSGASVLSTTIQTAMLMQRAMDPLTDPPSEGAFGQRLFTFTDDLDVTNRLYFDLLDAEGLNSWGNPEKPSLAALRNPVGGDLQARRAAGQLWDALEADRTPTRRCRAHSDRTNDFSGRRCRSPRQRDRRDGVARGRVQRSTRGCGAAAQGAARRRTTSYSGRDAQDAVGRCDRGRSWCSPTTAAIEPRTSRTNGSSIQNWRPDRSRSRIPPLCGCRPCLPSSTGLSTASRARRPGVAVAAAAGHPGQWQSRDLERQAALARRDGARPHRRRDARRTRRPL